MIQNFDYFGMQEVPAIVLCNPNKEELFSLQGCTGTNIKLSWNSQSEFTFQFPKTINGVEMEAFDFLEGKRLVLLDGIAYFVIVDVQDNDEGAVPLKTVTCFSHESELVFKKLNRFTGTYLFYDATNPTSGSTLMGVIMDMIPTWSIGTISSTVAAKYRTFDISDSNIYQFLTTDAATSYDCIFVFDNLNKSISVSATTDTAPATDIYLSFDNLVKHTQYREITEEVTTAMHCYGGGGLEIRAVNPLGTNVIYDFTYYKSTEWMNQSLIDAITAWETKLDNYADTYAEKVVELSDYRTQLLSEQALLAEYESNLAAHRQVRAARVMMGLDTTDIDAQISNDLGFIVAQETLITISQANVATTLDELAAINLDLAFTNTGNFSASQYLELTQFIYENSYNNENIIITDIMTADEIRVQTQELYEDSLNVLAKAAVPRYEIVIDSVNFLALQEYEPFINQLELGSQITIDTGRGFTLSATLLQYEYSYDEPDQFVITISNRQRLDNGGFILSDLIGKSVQTSNTTAFNSKDWNDWSESKEGIYGQVITPDGVIIQGIKGENVVGIIEASGSLTIQNVNSTTGSNNFLLDKTGVTLRDPIIYDADGNLGLNLSLALAGGGELLFRNGIFIGGAGLEPGSSITTLEDLSGNSGSYFATVSLFLANSTRVYVNGILQRQDYTYSEGSEHQSIIMLDPVLTTDHFVVEYVPLSS